MTDVNSQPMGAGDGPKKEEESVELLIRSANPSKAKDLTLKLDLATTVQQVKERIRDEHTGNPQPSTQVLIFAGKVLKDPHTKLETVLQSVHGPGPYSFHLVVQGGDLADSSRRPVGRSDASRDAYQSRTAGVSRQGMPPLNRGNTQGPSNRFPGTPGPHPGPASTSVPPVYSNYPVNSGNPVQLGSQYAMLPSGAVPVPYMMINPVVSAAYSAAMAAMSGAANGEDMPSSSMGTAQVAGGGESQAFFPQVPAFLPPSFPQQVAQNQSPVGQVPTPGLGQSSTPSSSSTPQQAVQPNAPPPLIPAIALFPLGVPVLVPANTPPVGFQLNPQGNPGGAVHRSPVYQFDGQRQGGVFQPGMHQHHHHHHRVAVRPRRRRVVMYRISVRGLLQFVLLLLLLWSYTSKENFFLLLGLFCMFYIGAGPIRRVLHQFNGVGDRRQRGFFQEILTLVIGFVTSVLPTWNVNVQDEAAFAAAQQMVDREERREQNRAEQENLDQNLNARPHQD